MNCGTRRFAGIFALKFKDWSFKTNALRYIFLILSAVLLLTIKFLAVPVIVALYIISSVVQKWDLRTGAD